MCLCRLYSCEVMCTSVNAAVMDLECVVVVYKAVR